MGPVPATGPIASYLTVTQLSEGFFHSAQRLVPNRGQVVGVDVEG
jgi:hypothetical protein